LLVKLPNGRWMARLWTGGRGSQRIAKAFETKKDAKDWEDEQRRCLNRGTYISPKSIPTFREAAAEWLTSKDKKRPSTIASWQAHLDLHLNPLIGGLRLDQIRVAVIETQVRDPLCQKLSSKTVNKLLTTLGAVFKMAVRRGYCISNPVADVERAGPAAQELSLDDDISTREPKDDIAVQPDEVLSAAEIRLMLVHAKPGFDRTVLMTAAMTGLRDGELLGLQWSDIEFTTCKLHVRRSLSWARLRNSTEPTRPRFYKPKTKTGNRSVPLAPELSTALKTWKLRCPKSDLDLVFPTLAGKPAHRSNVLRYGLHPALRRAGLRKVSLHSLRHSFASILLMNGTVITEVQKLMGHSDPNVTLKVYSHFLPDRESNSVQTLAKSLVGFGDETETSAGGHCVDSDHRSGPLPDFLPVAVNDAEVLENVGSSVAPPARLERATPGLGILCSVQLS
jgi:integrase